VADDRLTVADPTVVNQASAADPGVFDALTTATGNVDCARAAIGTLVARGWSPGHQFDAPASAPPSLRCLWVMVRAWEESTEGLTAREKDRCIAYLTSLLQGERRSQDATVNVAPLGQHR
jgi:hypothetical protein